MDEIRVIFVDDEEELVSAVVERLALRDIDATGATDPVDALRKIEEGDFAVAVIDVRMPGMGGIEMLRLLRTKHPDLMVVLLTGHGSPESAEKGTALGAFEYLQKPVDIDLLAEIIRKAASGGERSVQNE